MRQRNGLKHSRNNRRIRINVPHYVIPTAAPAEWRNPPRGMMNHHKLKLATWEDSSTPFHYARNDIIGGAVLFCPQELSSPRSGTAHRPFPTDFNGRIQKTTLVAPIIVNCPLSIVNSSFVFLQIERQQQIQPLFRVFQIHVNQLADFLQAVGQCGAVDDQGFGGAGDVALLQ